MSTRGTSKFKVHEKIMSDILNSAIYAGMILDTGHLIPEEPLLKKKSKYALYNINSISPMTFFFLKVGEEIPCQLQCKTPVYGGELWTCRPWPTDTWAGLQVIWWSSLVAPFAPWSSDGCSARTKKFSVEWSIQPSYFWKSLSFDIWPEFSSNWISQSSSFSFHRFFWWPLL